MLEQHKDWIAPFPPPFSSSSPSQTPVATLLMWIRWTRQSHALEHATIHVLNQWNSGLRLMGRSTPTAFYLYGDVTTETVRSAAEEALERLRKGESALAIHPRCGTNLVVSSILAGLAATVVFSRQRKFRWEAIPDLFLAISLALFIAQPLGYAVQQRFTTSMILDGIQIGEITQHIAGQTISHRIELKRD